MANTKAADLSHPAKVLQYIEITGEVLTKSAALIANKEAQDKRVAALIPQAVEALLANERIMENEKEAAANVLKDPVKVLEVLIKTAGHRNDSERARLGTQAGRTKKAAYNSLNDPYVGRRTRPDESESDKAFRQGLGL